MRADDLDAYAVLGVDPDASAEELKSAHRRLVRRYHPDLAEPADRPEATRQVQRVNVAYGLVRHPAARDAYDRLRVEQTSSRLRASRLDRDMAAAWEALVNDAGRWAGRWWRFNRARVRRAAVHATLRARRGTVALVTRVQVLILGLAGALAGLVLPVAAGRLLGVTTLVSQLVGVAAGWWVGTARGQRRRLQALGLPASTRRGWAEPAAATAAVGLAMALDAVIA